MVSPSSPLHIVPLYEYQEECPSIEKTLQRIVTKSTNPDLHSVDAEIETLLLESPTGKRRVVIKGSNIVHVSLQLTNDDDAHKLDHGSNALLCWTSFANQPDITLLCVLSSPTMVCLFDIYGQDSIAGGEGHQIYLPCEARSIFALPAGGFLIQRKNSPDDTTVDEEFMLQDPPTVESSPITSLFSVEHALDPALPVTTIDNHCIDVMEKVLWVGEASWAGKNSLRNLCVSYHVQTKRHSIWTIQAASPAPPARPLWELSSFSRVEVVADTVLLEDRDNSMYSPHITRNEALADALGVARRNRPAVDQEGIEPPSNPLHPSICMHLIYEESKESTEAKKIFIATSLNGRSPLLCLFGNGKLKFFTLGISGDESVFVSSLTSQLCLSAEPIKAFLLAPNLMTTDIVVVTNNGQLELFCGTFPMVSCSLPQGHTAVAVDHSVGNRIDVVDKNGTKFRTILQCRLDSNTLSERALFAIETALLSVDEFELARRLRMDCLRFIQKDDVSEEDSWPIVARFLALLVSTNGTCASRPQTSVAESYAGESSQWEKIIHSDYHMNYKDNGELFFRDDDNSFLPRTRSVNDDVSTCTLSQLSSKIDHSFGKLVFDTLHLLYEESKLHTSMDWQRKIAKFLISLCLVANDGGTMTDFLQHYESDLGSEFSCAVQPNPVFLSGQAMRRSDLTSFVEPPCFFSSIEQLIRQGIHGEHKNIFFCDKPADILISDALGKMRVVRKAFSALFDESADHNSSVCKTVMVLVNEGYDDFTSLEDHFPIGIAVPLVEALLYCRRNPDILSELSASLPPAAWRLIGREDVKQQVTIVKTEDRGNSTSPFQGSFNIAIDEDKDGIVPMEHGFQMLFPRDNRLYEVGKLLRSSRPTFLKVQRAVEVSDHDFERMKQERLLVLCRRVQALPLGRGMFTLGSLEPIPAEPLEVPKLCLSGRVPPNNATLVLDTETLSCPKNMTVWPEFHNGVAAGLRLPLAYDDGKGKVPMISRAWIVSNRSAGRQELPQRNQQSSESNNESTESDKRPTHAHGGVLMALGLRGHLSALSMTDIYEYLTQGSVTTSVGILLGMSATKRGSCDPAVSKMLCLHIPSLLPASFSSIDVSGPAHAAAVTGIGLLYQGSSHRLMTEFLLNEMGRRPTQDSNTTDREAYALSCGLSLGMVNLAQGDATESLGGGNAGLADLDIELRLNRYVVGGIDTREERRRHDAFDGHFAGHNDGERCSRINEGDTINNDVTAPGATLALGLMYLKSGNKAVASSLALPDTHFLLEYVRPDFLLLRVVARAMILWDEVEPTVDWINLQIPAVVRESYEQLHEAALKENGLAALDPRPKSNEEKRTEHVGSLEQDVDKTAVRQIYAFVTAGACFGVGLRFAGTGNQTAAQAIVDRILALSKLRDGSNPATISLRPECPVLEMCLGLCAISLSLVMAGTGDLDALRHLKVLRWKCNEDVKYGNHMSYNAAIGLLFLGGGTQTVGRSNDDIAALAIAFFPRFPATTSDNHYHLQALRHFYALAAKEKIIQAIDIDTGVSASVPVQVHYKDSIASKTINSPCLLLNSNEYVTRMSVTSNLYYPSHIDFDEEARRGTTIFVKKRILGYSPRSLITSVILEERPKSTSHGIVHEIRQVRGGRQQVTDGKEEATYVYAELVRCLESSASSPKALWGFRLIQAYYENKNQIDNLIHQLELARLIVELEGKLMEAGHSFERFSAWFGQARSRKEQALMDVSFGER